MGFVRRWLTGMIAKRRRAGRVDVRTLLSLDDRTLADIGVRRVELAAVANGHLPLDQLTVQGPIGPTEGQPPAADPIPPTPPQPERWDEAA